MKLSRNLIGMPILLCLFFHVQAVTSTDPQNDKGIDAVEMYLHRNSNPQWHAEPKEINPELDCEMRKLFLEKALENLAWRQNNNDIKEALEIEGRCAGSASATSEQTHTVATSTATQRRLRTEKKTEEEQEGEPHFTEEPVFTVYVCPKEGSDEHPGNRRHPYRTVHRALKETRDQCAPHDPKTIVLRPGIHFLKKPIVLTPKDSQLTIESDSDSEKRAWLSGGTLLESHSAKWFPMVTHPHIWVAHNVSWIDHDITGLFTVHPHRRLTLARYPNADVEVWDAKDRYDTIDEKTDEWIFPPPAGVPDFSAFVNLTDPNNPSGHTKVDSAMPDYNRYGTGQGGACATVWGDLPSYWCSNVSAGGWANVDQAAAKAGRLNLPAGLKLGGDSSSKFRQRVKNWKNNPKGAIFHISHSQGWAWHMFNVSSIQEIKDSTHIAFDKGGWQGGRNWECKDKDGHMTHCDGDDKRLHGGPWYVEGVLDELDAPGEFYWDKEAKKLYFYPDNCDEDSKDSGPCFPPDLVATNLKTLIRMDGTKENSIVNLHVKGIGFRDAAKTYMTEQWSAPSGGDWALHRGGAVHLEGTFDVGITDCLFERLDGNAILLGGYNRGTRVLQSEFSYLGEGAMATWGDTENGYDATGGAQPRFSMIANNVMSNLGLYEKQSSAWGQNKACQNVILNNVMFNLPRAAINFNDGLGGGNFVEGNVIFNTCRESGDHGPINSWDRMPFLTNSIDGRTPSFTPLPTKTRQNIILANYGSSQGFDNDDGSSFYHTTNNVFYQADGFKMDYGGHSSRFENNFVYSDNKKCYGTGSFLKGYADVFNNNTCILAQQKEDAGLIGHMFQCSLENGMNPITNKYYTATGNGTFTCGNQEKITLEQLQMQSFELGSTLKVLPSTETIMAWVRVTLEEK